MSDYLMHVPEPHNDSDLLEAAIKLREEVDRLRAELDKVRAERDEITRDYDLEHNRANMLASEIEPLRYELSGRKLEIVAIKQQFSESNAQVADLRARLNSFESLLELARAELATERERNRWVPVGERLPEKGGIYEVFICIGDHRFRNDVMFLNGSWVYYQGAITHWRPLPEPPEEQQPENTTIRITGNIPRGKPLTYFGDEEQQP